MSTENQMGPDEARLFQEFATAFNAIEAETYERHIEPELEKKFTEIQQSLTQASRQFRIVYHLIPVIATFTVINCGIFLYLLCTRWH